MNQVWIIVFIIVLVGVSLVFYFSPSYGPKILASASGPYSLDKKTTIIQEQDARSFYSDSNGSFSAFVYLNPMNRTGANVPCGTANNQASCTDGTFPACVCDTDTGNCAKCDHVGYNSVFNISGIAGLEVMIAPDASRQGKAMAQFIVKTEGLALTEGASASGSPASGSPASGSPASGSPKPVIPRPKAQIYIETLSLPTIPLQKWTYITIARDGRRFDIYYNDRLVLSKKTDYMPISNGSKSSVSGITSGSPGLMGQLALANLYNYRLSTKDIASFYSQYADTRGTPYLNNPSNPLSLSDLGGLLPSYSSVFSINLPSINLCPSGGCLSPPTIKPANPLYKWTPTYG